MPFLTYIAHAAHLHFKQYVELDCRRTQNFANELRLSVNPHTWVVGRNFANTAQNQFVQLNRQFSGLLYAVFEGSEHISQCVNGFPQMFDVPDNYRTGISVLTGFMSDHGNLLVKVIGQRFRAGETPAFGQNFHARIVSVTNLRAAIDLAHSHCQPLQYRAEEVGSVPYRLQSFQALSGDLSRFIGHIIEYHSHIYDNISATSSLNNSMSMRDSCSSLASGGYMGSYSAVSYMLCADFFVREFLPLLHSCHSNPRNPGIAGTIYKRLISGCEALYTCQDEIQVLRSRSINELRQGTSPSYQLDELINFALRLSSSVLYSALLASLYWSRGGDTMLIGGGRFREISGKMLEFEAVSEELSGLLVGSPLYVGEQASPVEHHYYSDMRFFATRLLELSAANRITLASLIPACYLTRGVQISTGQRLWSMALFASKFSYQLCVYGTIMQGLRMVGMNKTDEFRACQIRLVEIYCDLCASGFEAFRGLGGYFEAEKERFMPILDLDDDSILGDDAENVVDMGD